jgi:hypothetical protein
LCYAAALVDGKSSEHEAQSQHDAPRSWSDLVKRDSLGFMNNIGPDWKHIRHAHFEAVEKEKAFMERTKHMPFRNPEGNNQTSKQLSVYWSTMWWPTFHCAAAERLGSTGDGGKWVCDPWRISQQESCLIYSIGSNNDFSFEHSLHQRLGPVCEIHTFDHTIGSDPSNKPPFVNFHPVGLSNERILELPSSSHERAAIGSKLLSLNRIVKRNNHESRAWIDILKIDCERCELDTVSSWFASGVPPIRQILVEVHLVEPGDTAKLESLMGVMRAHGYVVFSRETNLLAPDKVQFCCSEISFIKMEFAHSH